MACPYLITAVSNLSCSRSAYFILIFLLSTVLVSVHCQSSPETSVFKWKTVAYRPLDKSQNDQIGGFPYYVRENIIATSIAFHAKTSVLYIAAPRIKPGVVATLNRVDLYDTYHLISPIWTPYPNAELNELQPGHFPEDSQEFQPNEDCEVDWKKGPGFCKGLNDTDKNIPDLYLPEEFLTDLRSTLLQSRHRKRAAYNDTGVKIAISRSFPVNLKDLHRSSSSAAVNGDEYDYANYDDNRREVEKEEYHVEENEKEDSFRYSDSNYQRRLRSNQLKSIISVNSVVVDKCDRLWFVDTGVLDYYRDTQEEEQHPIHVQSPSIWAVDIRDRDLFLVVRRYRFSSHVVGTPAGLRGFAVDVRGDCDSAVAYISNAIDNRIVVYDMAKEDSWWFSDPSMEPQLGPPAKLRFDDLRVKVNLGVTAVALGLRDSPWGRSLYYVPYSSQDLFLVSTGNLMKRDVDKAYGDDFLNLGTRGSKAQTETLAFDEKRGILFYAEVQTRSIKCWNVRNELRRSSIGTIFESEELVYPAHLSVDAGGNLWVLSNNYFPRFLEQSFDHREFNMHIFRIVIKNAIKNTVCE